MKRNTKHVPGSRTLMPIVVDILQKNGGTLSYLQVVYMVLFKHDLPKSLFKKACTEVGFSGTYLRKIDVLKTDTKKGIWSLREEFMNLSYDEVKRVTYDKYDVLLGRK